MNKAHIHHLPQQPDKETLYPLKISFLFISPLIFASLYIINRSLKLFAQQKIHGKNFLNFQFFLFYTIFGPYIHRSYYFITLRTVFL